MIRSDTEKGILQRFKPMTTAKGSMFCIRPYLAHLLKDYHRVDHPESP